MDLPHLHKQLLARASSNTFMISVGEVMAVVEAMQNRPWHVSHWLERSNSEHVYVKALAGDDRQELFRGRFVGYLAEPSIQIRVAPGLTTNWPLSIVEELSLTDKLGIDQAYPEKRDT